MDNVFKKIVILTICSVIFVVGISIFFFKGEMSSAKDIEDIDNLTGQRIGTISAYEGDYVLSDRDDLTLLRFDSESDCLLALYYKQVDALAFSRETADYILSVTTGLKIDERPIATTGLVSIFAKDSDYLHKYNKFIEEYRKTEEYKQYCEKVDTGGFYDGSPIIEETGTGEVIDVGYVAEYLPVSFYDTILHRPNGVEIEMIIRFANYYNYKINWMAVTETTCFPLLQGGDIDIACASYTDVYRSEFEISEYYDLSSIYKDTDIALLEVEDYDEFSFLGLIESEGE